MARTPKLFKILIYLPLILIFISENTKAESLSIGSWNVHGGREATKILSEIAETKLGHSTFLHLQEAPSDDPNNFASSLGEEFGYYVHSVGFDSILSKYPFTSTGELLINPQTGRKSAWAEVQLPDGQPIRLYSQHLSYKVKKSPFIGKTRGKEMDVILNHAKNFNGPVIIAGDLNTVGWLLFGHAKEPAIKALKAAGFYDALQKIGGKTHDLVGRIDWIFQKGLTLKGSERGSKNGSDHHWIWADFQYP